MRGAGVAPVDQPAGSQQPTPPLWCTCPSRSWSQLRCLVGRGTCVWTTYPRLLRGMPRSGIELATFRSRVANSNHWATADDTQILGSCRPSTSQDLLTDAYVCMHRWGCGVDAFQSVSAEHCEGRVSLVHSQPPSSSAAAGSCYSCFGHYTVSQKTCDYIFYNNFNNKCPITIIFGTVSSQSMRHRKMVSFPTSPI